jgi:uncharacterized protein with HEPN domain
LLCNLLILGEAAKRLPGEITGRYATIEWRQIAGFRDVLSGKRPIVLEWVGGT